MSITVHNSQSGNNVNVNQLIDGYIKCGISLGWNIFSTKNKCCNVDEPWEHYAKWKKPVTKEHNCMIPLTWCAQNRQIYRDAKISGCLELGVGGVGGCQLRVVGFPSGGKIIDYHDDCTTVWIY